MIFWLHPDKIVWTLWLFFYFFLSKGKLRDCPVKDVTFMVFLHKSELAHISSIKQFFEMLVRRSNIMRRFWYVSAKKKKKKKSNWGTCFPWNIVSLSETYRLLVQQTTCTEYKNVDKILQIVLQNVSYAETNKPKLINGYKKGSFWF